jgi:hypothetical protein
MVENYRLTKNTVTGVTNTGNNSARIYASEAEKKALEALAKAEEALTATEGLDNSKIIELESKLDKEITRSTEQDNVHTLQIKDLVENNNNTIVFVDNISDDNENFWTKGENK